MSRQTPNRGYILRDPSDYYSLEGIENLNTTKMDTDVADLYLQVQEAKEGLSNFIGSFATKAALDQYSGTKTKNDYAIVQADETHSQQVSRYIYNGTTWVYQYKINEKPFTQAQADAINSGITAGRVTTYDNHILNNNNPHEVTKAQLGLDSVDNTSDMNKPVSTAQQAELDKKVDIAQGSQNEGKVLGIDSQGNVIPVDQQGGATPEQLAIKLDKTKDIHKIEVVEELPTARDLYTMYMVVEEEEEWPGLKFAANSGKVEIDISDWKDFNESNLYYSSDGKTWYNEYLTRIESYRTILSPTKVNFSQSGKMYFWHKGSSLNKSTSKYISFVLPQQTSASGNINSMINFSDITPYCFINLFKNCTSLTQAPDLPATNLAHSCYDSMFYGCTSLTTAPELPANNLDISCYASMFEECTALTQASELPATTLAQNCYANMFYGCTALTTAPELPATQLAVQCYDSMFRGCSSLNSIKLSYTGDFSTDYFFNWVNNVSSTGNFYYNGSDTTRGSSAIPQNWAVQSF